MYFPAVMEKEAGEQTVFGRSDISTAISILGHGYLYNGEPQWNGPYRLKYDVYLILNDVQLKDAIQFAYRNSLTAGVTTGDDWETAEVVETHDQEVDDMEDGERADVANMENYFISTETPAECVLML